MSINDVKPSVQLVDYPGRDCLQDSIEQLLRKKSKDPFSKLTPMLKQRYAVKPQSLLFEPPTNCNLDSNVRLLPYTPLPLDID